MSTILVGIVPLIQIVVPIVLWYTWGKAKLASQSALGTNYERAWQAMQWGHVAAFAPSLIMWIPAYFSDKALEWYQWTGKYAKKAAPIVLVVVVTFLLVDAILAGTTSARSGGIWITLILYVELEILMGWFIPHF